MTVLAERPGNYITLGNTRRSAYAMTELSTSIARPCRFVAAPSYIPSSSVCSSHVDCVYPNRYHAVDVATLKGYLKERIMTSVTSPFRNNRMASVSVSTAARPPRHSRYCLSVLTLLLPMLIPRNGCANQSPAGAPSTVQSHLPSADDKTGTNPLNLQHSVTVSNQLESWPDNLIFNRAAYAYTMPLAGRRLAARLELPLVISNITGRTEAGFGDLAVRMVSIPRLTARSGLVVGLDTTWRTATNSALGIGRHSLAPFIQMALLPAARTIIAPRLSQQFSFSGQKDRPDINRTVLGLYMVWLPVPQMWFVAEPEVAFDTVRHQKYGNVAFEWGRLLFRGVGTFIRPSIGMGRVGARPFDWSIAFGFRITP